MRLGEILLDSGILDDWQLAGALDYSHTKSIPLGQVVKLLKLVSPEDLEHCQQTQRLIHLGITPRLAMEILNEVTASKEPFESILKTKLEEPENVAFAELESILLSEIKKGTKEPDILWLDSPSDELLSNGDNLFDEECFVSAERYYMVLRLRMEKEEGSSSDKLTPVLRRLANLCMVTERCPEAADLYAKILEIKKNTYGSEHPSVASALEDLADMHNVRGDYQNAQQLYITASSVHEKHLPASLSLFVNCLRRMLSCCKELESAGEHKRIGTLLTEAGLLTEEQLQKALKVGKQQDLPLGTVLRQESIINEKELQSFLELQALISEGILPGEAAVRAYKGSVLTGIPLMQLLQDAGLLERAEKEDKQLRLRLIAELNELITAELRLGPYHRDVAVLATRVGDVHKELGHLMDAENFYQRALHICNRDKKTNVEILAGTSKKLGMVLMRSHRHLQAEPLFMEALDLLQAEQQAESKEAQEILQELSLLHYLEKNYAMCWNLFMSAIAIARKIDGVSSLTADFLDAFNRCAIELQHESEVEEIYMQTIRILRKSPSCNDRSLSILNMKLGDFYSIIGKRSKARAQFEIALKLLSRTATEDDKELQALQNRMDELKASQV